MLNKNQDKYEQQKRTKPAIPTKPINIPPPPAPVVQQSSAVLQQQKNNISTGAATENSANVKKLTQRISEYETNRSKTAKYKNNNKVIGPSGPAITTSSSSSSPNCSNDCCGILLNTISATTNPCQYTDKIPTNMKSTIYDSNNSISSSNSNGFKDESWLTSMNSATAPTKLQQQNLENAVVNCNIKPQNIQNIVQYQQSSKQLEHILVQRLEKENSQSPNRLTMGISGNIKNQIIGDHGTQQHQQQTSSIISNTTQMKIQLKLQEEMKQHIKCIQEKFLIEKRLPQQPYKWDDSSGGTGNRSQPAIGLKQTPKLRNVHAFSSPTRRMIRIFHIRCNFAVHSDQLELLNSVIELSTLASAIDKFLLLPPNILLSDNCVMCHTDR